MRSACKTHARLQDRHQARLLAATPNRLFTDAFGSDAWRERGFFPVLNERQQSPQANTQASVLARTLLLKQQYPLPPGDILPKPFDFSLDRNQSCPTIEEFDHYAQSQPYAGMPYGLPGLSTPEHNALLDWLKHGAAMPQASTLPDAELAEVDWAAHRAGVLAAPERWVGLEMTCLIP